MKALLYTSDPCEPSGVIGLFETEEQKQAILSAYAESVREELKGFGDIPGERLEARVEDHVRQITEIEIPVGVFGKYY